MKRATGLRWMIAVVVIGALGAALSASSRSVAVHAQAATRQADDVLPALLVEVRGLRAAMEQMASAGPRVQLFVSRLQLQEGRITAMARRLDDVRDRLIGAQRGVAEAEQEQARIEAAADMPGNSIPREQLPLMLSRAKSEIADRKATVARLTAEEMQLAQDITAEQARWTDINQRLDELERALVKR